MLRRNFGRVQTAQQHFREGTNIQCHPCNISNSVFHYRLFNILFIYSIRQSPSSEANTHFMEPKDSTPQSQVPANCPYPEPVRSNPTSRRSILILSSHLRLCLPNSFFPSGFPTKTLYSPLLSPIRSTCPAHLVLLDFIKRTILGEQ
jgi:hypothetical protein